MPADACRTDVSCESCLNLVNDTCPTAVSSEACASWHLPHWCEQSSMSESDDWHMPHSCEQWSMPESADWHLPHCLWWKWNGSNCTRNNTMTSDLTSSQIKMITLAHIVNLGGLLYSDLCETLCVCVCVSEWVCVCVSVCLWKWQWGGGGGGRGGIWWPEQFSSMPGVSKSNTFRTCVQRKQKFFLNAHNQTWCHTHRLFKKKTTILHLPSWNFCLVCLLQNSVLLSCMPAADFCTSVLCAYCRILCFCLVCLLQNYVTLLHIWQQNNCSLSDKI